MNMALLEIGSCVSFAMTEEVKVRLIYAGTLLAVVIGCALITWLLGCRKRKHKRKQPHRWEEKLDLSDSHHAHKHRHKSRKERPQNPTLAKTGGLPPRKTDSASSSGSDSTESITKSDPA